MTDEKVIVVTVNWNRYGDTCACLDSLIAQEGVQVDLIVVDNGSTDNSETRLREKYPQLRICKSEKNLGFAGGFNLGIGSALDLDADRIMIINNDTVAEEGMIRALLDEMHSEEIGVTSPVIYYFSNPTKIWSCGGNFNKIVLTPINSHHKSETLSDPVNRTFLSGCCLLMKRELIESIGLFDERFFLYYEDLDYCLRIMHSKWRMKVVPAAKLLHKVSISSGGELSPKERYYTALSSGLYYRKHMTLGNFIFIIPFRIISTVLWVFRLLFRGNFVGMSAFWKGMFDGSGLKKNSSDYQII
jgi:hypothetical protein